MLIGWSTCGNVVRAILRVVRMALKGGMFEVELFSLIKSKHGKVTTQEPIPARRE